MLVRELQDLLATLYDAPSPHDVANYLITDPREAAALQGRPQAPSTDELIYAWHPDGFALHSMRSSTVSRFYLQVPNETDLDDWSDDRIWQALADRLGHGQDGWELATGPITERSVLPMRSYVQEPMRHGRLFLAGDAAHIVPPTGAKGMNLAVADVRVLARALTAFFRQGREDLLDAYSETCLHRVWRAEHFSWWMTSMLHRFPGDDAFQQRLQIAQLRYTTSSVAAATKRPRRPWTVDRAALSRNPRCAPAAPRAPRARPAAPSPEARRARRSALRGLAGARRPSPASETGSADSRTAWPARSRCAAASAYSDECARAAAARTIPPKRCRVYGFGSHRRSEPKP